MAPSATSISVSSQPKESTPHHSSPTKSFTSTLRIYCKLKDSLKRASHQDPEALNPKEEDLNKEDSEADLRADSEADHKTGKEEALVETEVEEEDSEAEVEDDSA